MEFVVLFDDYLLSVIHVDALHGRLALDAATVQRVPGILVESHLARLRLQAADASHLAVGSNQAHLDGLRQFLVSSSVHAAGSGVVR